MARYAFACPSHGEFDAFFPMGEAPEKVACEQIVLVKPRAFNAFQGDRFPCRLSSARVYSFNFQEDRRRMRSGISPATGKPYAESRAQERMIEQASGIVFAGKNDLLPHERQAIAYAEHVKTGGDTVENPVHIPVEKSPPLTSYMEKMNYKRREFAPETFTKEHQDRQFREIVAKSETA